MVYNIKSNQSINGLEFGANIEQVHDAFGKNYKSFKKNKFAKNLTEAYPSFHVYFKSNHFEAIEFFDLNNTFIVDGATLLFDNIDNVKVLFPEIKKYDYDTYIDINHSIGIGVENDKIISLLFGIKGYYNFL